MNVSLSFGNAEKQRLEATRAIVLYENPTAALATIHEITRPEKEGAPLLMAGVLLTRDTLDKILEELSGSGQTTHRLLPPSILCAEKGFMAWHVSARRLPIFFNTKDTAFNKEMEGATVLHPPLLFAAKPRVLSVWALGSATRPDAKTPVYRAPYYNLYEGGNMCAGTVSLPPEPLVSDLEVWEKAFYDTNFTHANFSGKLTAHPKDHNGLWRDMAKKREGEIFPANWLQPIKSLTVGKVIQG